MFLFSGKKLIYVIMGISIAIFCVLYMTENKSEAVSTPVSNHVIVLDAGHGLPDRWCRGK